MGRLSHIASIAWALALPCASWAQCESPADSAELGRLLNDAEYGFSNFDVGGFMLASDAWRSRLPCLGEVIPPTLAARLHRFEGLRSVLEREPERAALSFAAGRNIEPHYEFPKALVPAGNPVRDYYTQVNLGNGSSEDVPPPASGAVVIDGWTFDKRPLDWPAIVQLVADGGAVKQTVLLQPGEPLPDYEVRVDDPDEPITETAPVVVLPPPPVQPEPNPRVAWLAATGGAAAVLLVGTTAAAVSHAKFQDLDTPYEDLADTRRATNTWVVVAGVGGAATLGTGVGLAVSW